MIAEHVFCLFVFRLFEGGLKGFDEALVDFRAEKKW